MRNFELFLRCLIWYSVVTYIFELSLGHAHSHDGSAFWLWSERIVALIFTFEYGLRWWRSCRDNGISNYPRSVLGIIDLVAIVPFWLGFLAHPALAIIPVGWLALIRTLRLLRLCKLLRYNRSLQLVALGFYRAYHDLKALMLAMAIVGSFTAVLIYEIERTRPATDADVSANSFDSLFNCFWYIAVTITTVGYGDMSPASVFGKCVMVIFFGFALAIYAGVIGTVGSHFVNTIKEERDPNIDPIGLFMAELQNRKQLKRQLKQAMERSNV